MKWLYVRSPWCRGFHEDSRADMPITSLIVATAAARYSTRLKTTKLFLSLLVEAKKRHRVKLFGFCLMPNHFHLVLEPTHQTALSQFMQWLLTSHVRRYHQHYGSSGHIWQGRFKSFPVQRDGHLMTVLRYVLQNPVRAGLSSTAGCGRVCGGDSSRIRVRWIKSASGWSRSPNP